MNEKKARVIALYLPQFHPTPENDRYWGKGFTEWTNVAKATPLFRGHAQPRIPADLGFYDLRLPQIRNEQAELAKEAGIEGFLYWHYWFGNGKETLQMPLDEMVRTKTPDYPFCIGWAAHDWTTKTWRKGKALEKNEIIFKQEFPGEDDHKKHFYRLLDAFKDNRYIRVDGKLLFAIINPHNIPDTRSFFELWNRLADENGLGGFHFVGITEPLSKLNITNIRAIDQNIEENIDRYKDLGLDAVCTVGQKYAEIKSSGRIRKIVFAMARRIFGGGVLDKYDYSKIVDHYYSPSDKREDVYPQLIAGWDRSPRSGRRAIIYYNDTPDAFGKAVDNVVDCIKNKNPEHRIVFLNSWNEWGEGAYMEPDLRYGRGKLEALKKHIFVNRG
jgi:hypothetical protein